MRLAFRQKYLCASCQQLLHWDSHVDHIVPWCLSADDSDANVQVLCPNCHASKSADEMGRILLVRRKLVEMVNSGMSQSEGLCWACLKVVSLYFDTHACTSP